MNSGLCKGGPYGGKPLHHSLLECFVARCRLTKGIVTWHESGVSTEDVEVGRYQWEGDHWLWKSPTGSTK